MLGKDSKNQDLAERNEQEGSHRTWDQGPHSQPHASQDLKGSQHLTPCPCVQSPQDSACRRAGGTLGGATLEAGAGWDSGQSTLICRKITGCQPPTPTFQEPGSSAACIASWKAQLVIRRVMIVFSGQRVGP